MHSAICSPRGLSPVFASATLLLASFAAASAQTVPLTVNNFSFELPDVGTGTSPSYSAFKSYNSMNTTERSNFAWSATNWERVLVQYDSRLAASPTLPQAPDGDQWLVLDQRTFSANTTSGSLASAFQNVGTIAADTTYTLNITVGRRSGNALATNFSFGLWSDASASSPSFTTSLVTRNQSNFTQSGTGNATQSYTLVWDSATNPGLVGQNLFIRMAVGANDGAAKQVLFDNISLTAATIPEPSTFSAVAGLVVLGFGALRRRRARG